MVKFMRIRNYEKIYLVIYMILLLFILEILFVCYLVFNKRYSYIKFNGIIRTDNFVMIMVKDRQIEYFYQSNYLYHDSKKRKFEIIEIDKNVYKEKGEYYHSILIKVKTDNNSIDNDIYEFSLVTEKYRSIEIFKLILEE